MTRTPAENIRLLTNMDPSIHIYLSNSANILFRRAFPNALPMEAASMDLLRKFGDEVEAIIVSCDDTKLDQAIAAKVGEWKQVQPEQRVFQFAVLPSNIRPRLLVSRESKFAFSFGLKSYVPGKGFSRVLQRILRLLGPSSIPSRYILSLKGNRESTFWIDALFEATGLSGQLCSLITGGEGDTNTAVVVLKSPEESVYAKIAISEIAKQNVKNESYWLEKLALHDLNEFRVPQLKYFGIFGDTFISATKSIGEKLVQVKKPQAQLIQAIVRLNNIEQRTLPILQTAQAVCISEWMQRDYDDSIIALKPNWEILCSELALVNVPVGVGHGDFTPWNILQNREKLYSCWIGSGPQRMLHLWTT